MQIALAIAAALVLALALAITLGGPAQPAPMASINDPFRSVDVSDLPPLGTYRADDGQFLGYREYRAAGAPAGSVTLVHGSSASSASMHSLAKALAAAGYRVFALDVRGHGASGSKGHIDYVGQLEADLAAFVRTVRPAPPSTLAGFSSGGGFVLRVGAGGQQSLFGSYLLLSPFLHQNAPNRRPGSGGWVEVGLPRILGLLALNAVGVHRFNALPVTSFALNEQARRTLTPQYDFNLALNFRPHDDYQADIRRLRAPCAVIAGTADEAFRTEALPDIVRAAGRDWPVELLPGIGHVALTLDPLALAAAVRQVGRLQRQAASCRGRSLNDWRLNPP